MREVVTFTLTTEDFAELRQAVWAGACAARAFSCYSADHWESILERLKKQEAACGK